MILLKKDFKQGFVSLKITLPDDLWYLSHIISPGDVMTMKTERKLKIGSSENAKSVRKVMVLTLAVESVDFSDATQLRVKGLVAQETDDVPKDAYHTFGVQVNDTFTLKKSVWPSYLINKLHEAQKNTSQSILIVQYDRETALFSFVRQTGIEHVAEIKATVQKKQFDQGSDGSLYDEIIKQIAEYKKTTSLSGIVFASADFWKRYVQDKLPEELKKMSIFVSTPDVAKSSVNKLLTRPELHNLLANQRLQKEQSFIDVLLEKLDKDMVVYGFDDVLQAAKAGAVADVGITEKYLEQSKSTQSYDALDALLRDIDAAKGQVWFLHAEETAKVVDGLGGIAGVLRWKLV
jgi:protein pelota